ncbi:MAG: hypothetical protein ICV84_11995 [Flavisolibacter sp.]|nr:hypothetical protein [Flavisolibacter sp.]MBD0351005.1 hypothetical protein [Flavisolibacter sp.]
MRRSSFLIAAVTALITFASLHFFIGARYRPWYGWHGRYYYYDDWYYRRPYAPPQWYTPDSLQRNRWSNEAPY